MPGRIRTRETGALAEVGRLGAPRVTSVTGGAMPIATRPSEAGFSPLDLLFAALAGCLVVSARSAAGELGLLDRFETATARVNGEKAVEGPSRVEAFHVELTIAGDLDEGERARIAARAEELCTVSNTLHGAPRIVLRHG
ncbi:OsmC family protein [Kaistia geumhonensis]|uniref:OsmC-like protein n=1 Tax=Kaistia geumhonensis TaxID=410839 RepID=A0ABU0M894_9HYPH|nr:OsmC family protein [Kaistia geumhonensis]MCX5477610.1 OsmC family protein [Kaistia geumhonensis]MDQ0517182.1 putative OsmC-like protein [Kaistia geumhonensis]